MKISRDSAIQILKYCDKYKKFNFPFFVMCKEYSPEDDDFVEIGTDEWQAIEDDDTNQTFELWEKQPQSDIDLILDRLKILIKNYKKYLKKEASCGENSESSDLHQFISGKLDAYEECRDMVLKIWKAV